MYKYLSVFFQIQPSKFWTVYSRICRSPFLRGVRGICYMLSVTYMYCIIELGTRFIILVTSSMMPSKKVMHEAAKVFQDLLTIKGSHFVAPTPFTSHQVFPLSSLASHLSYPWPFGGWLTINISSDKFSKFVDRLSPQL